MLRERNCQRASEESEQRSRKRQGRKPSFLASNLDPFRFFPQQPQHKNNNNNSTKHKNKKEEEQQEKTTTKKKNPKKRLLSAMDYFNEPYRIESPHFPLIKKENAFSSRLDYEQSLFLLRDSRAKVQKSPIACSFRMAIPERRESLLVRRSLLLGLVFLCAN